MDRDWGRFWLVKYISPRYLARFIQDPRLAVPATPGFTWGDAVYAAPIAHACSGMIYGRAGIIGWVAYGDALRAFDAVQRRGRELYQEWIRFSVKLHELLTTTIHADLANRALRNSFRRRFGIDIVHFLPDQFNSSYINRRTDHWFAITDPAVVKPQAPGARPVFSNTVQDCRWVAVVGEEFSETTWKTHYRDLFGPHIRCLTIDHLRRSSNIGWDIFNRYLRPSGSAAAASAIVLVEP